MANRIHNQAVIRNIVEGDEDLDLNCQKIKYGCGWFTDKPVARCARKETMEICDYAGPVYMG